MEEEYEEAVSKVTLQHIIRDLEPSTSYTFYVKAYTSHGASKPSDDATETTHGEGELTSVSKRRGQALISRSFPAGAVVDGLCRVAVPAPPVLHTKVLNSSVIQASWEPSSKLGQHQGYRLYYKGAQTALFSGPIVLPRNTSQYNITQLGELLRLKSPSVIQNPTYFLKHLLPLVRSFARLRDQAAGLQPARRRECYRALRLAARGRGEIR